MGISIFELSEGYTMKISTKGRYGLTLMISLAKKRGKDVSLKSIAEENNLSDLYLEQLVGPLRNAGVNSSVYRC